MLVRTKTLTTPSSPRVLPFFSRHGSPQHVQQRTGRLPEQRHLLSGGESSHGRSPRCSRWLLAKYQFVKSRAIMWVHTFKVRAHFGGKMYHISYFWVVGKSTCRVVVGWFTSAGPLGYERRRRVEKGFGFVAENFHLPCLQTPPAQDALQASLSLVNLTAYFCDPLPLCYFFCMVVLRRVRWRRLRNYSWHWGIRVLLPHYHP